MSVSRPAETDAIEFFLNNPGMYIDPQSQPTQAGNDECWKNLLRRTSVLGHICESMHDGRSHLDATCDGNPYDTCCNVLGRIDEAHREILECNPPRFMTQLPCPGEPVVDFIFAGDSSMALVDEGLYAGTVKRTKRIVGEFLKAGRMDLLTEKDGSAQYSMHWGKGLKCAKAQFIISVISVRERSTSCSCRQRSHAAGPIHVKSEGKVNEVRPASRKQHSGKTRITLLELYSDSSRSSCRNAVHL